MKRKYMKSRKLRGGLFGIFGKKAGDEDVAAEPQEEEEVKKDEGMLKGVMDSVTNISSKKMIAQKKHHLNW